METKTEAPVTLGLQVAAPAVTADEAVDEELLELDEEEEDDEDEDDEDEVELDPTVDEVELVDGIVPLVTPELVEFEALPAAAARSVSKKDKAGRKKGCHVPLDSVDEVVSVEEVSLVAPLSTMESYDPEVPS